MISFWEDKSLVHFDIIIIGSGICGLSTACSIKEKYSSLKVAIIERGIFSSGASTKNAGFACIGNPTEDLSDLELMGEDKLIELVHRRYAGLNILRKRLGDQKIQYESNGSHEIIFQNQIFEESQIDKLNKILFPLFKQAVFEKLKDSHEYFGFDKKKVKSIYKNKLDGQINTGMMMDSYVDYATNLGIRIFTGTHVESFHQEVNSIQLELKSAFHSLKFHTQKLAICTNAFSKSLLPDIDLKPGRGQVMVTSPIPNLQIKGTFSFDDGYYYFRDINNRVLFGGGRNLDFQTEETLE